MAISDFLTKLLQVSHEFIEGLVQKINPAFFLLLNMLQQRFIRKGYIFQMHV
jgi:hypothetical protein